MAANWLYWVTSILFVMFVLGHTYGFLSFPPSSAEGRAVYESMNSVHLAQSGGWPVRHNLDALLGLPVLAPRGGVVPSFLYFGPPAMMLSLLVALLVGFAAGLARS